MTEAHVRINLTANWTALQNLSGTSYKILMVLAQHADNAGRCFPSVETIAFEANFHVKTVYKALSELLTYGYTKILERTHFNVITGRKSPTVWQVSPFFLELADNMKDFAINLWNNIAEDSSQSIMHINQQQNQAPEQTPGDQYHKQQQQAPGEQKAKPQTANREPQKNAPPAQQPSVAPQRSLPIQNSGIVKFYTNPELVRESFEHEHHEMLVNRLTDYGLKATLARGLINAYGFSKCFVAADYVEYTSQHQDIENPAGFYRFVVQNDLIGRFDLREKRDYSTEEYDDYLEQ